MRPELTKYGDPILESVAGPFSDFDSVGGLSQKLRGFLTDQRIKWITAKHLGVNARMIVIEKALEDRLEFQTLINPEIIKFHGPIVSRVEYDFSLPGLNVSVERRAEATIRFKDENGEQHEKRFLGPACRLILSSHRSIRWKSDDNQPEYSQASEHQRLSSPPFQKLELQA